MLIIGSDNRYLFRKFGDRLFDIDPKVSTPIENSAGNLVSIDDFSENDADLDSSDSQLGTGISYNFDDNIDDQVGVLDAIKKHLQWHTGESRNEVELYCGSNRIIEVPTFMFDTITNQVSVTFKVRSGSTLGLTDNRLFHAARNADAGSILNAQVTDASEAVRFITGSRSGDINTTNDLSVANSVGGGATEDTIWTFTKNATTGEMKIYKKGVLVGSSTGNTLAMSGIERFVLGGTFDSKYWNGRVGFFRLDNKELTNEVIYHLANPSIAYQDWPMVDFSTMTISTLSGGLETGTATVLGTSIGMELSGEARRAINLGVSNYTVGYSTYLEFDFESTVEGDQHAIAILDSDGSTDWTKAFQLFGTVTTQGNQTFNNYQIADGIKHYKIQLGKELATTLANHGIIGLINTGAGLSRFFNIRLQEIVTLNPLNTSISLLEEVDWTPAYMATDVWGDAADTATISDTAGAVDQMNDKSGRGYHFVQPTPSERMTTGIRTLNGLNVLDGNGAQHMHVPLFSTTSSNVAFFMVAGIDVIDNTLDSIWSTDGSNFMELDALNSPNFDPRLRLSFQTNPTVINTPHNGPSIYNAYFDWTNKFVGGYIDGVQDIVQRSYLTQLDTTDIDLGMFVNYGGVSSPDGFVAEFLIVPDCTPETRQKIEGYLAHKWGLTANLPVGHPYKTVPPKVIGGSGSKTTIDEQSDLFFSAEDHVVTTDTKLEFKVNGAIEPDLFIVGVQNQSSGYEPTNHNFKLWGTAATPTDVNDTYDDYVGSNIPKLYSIPIGSYFLGQQSYARINVETLSTTLGLTVSDMQLVEPPLIPQDDDDSSLVVYRFLESEGGKVPDTSGNENHGLIINGDTNNPYSGRIVNFNSMLNTYPQTEPEYPDFSTNLLRWVSFDETLTGKFKELLANSPIYALGATYPSRATSPSGHSITLNGLNQWLAMNYTLALTNRSVSFWFKTTATGTVTLFSTGLGQQISGSDRYIDLVNGEIRAFLNAETITSSGLTLNDGQWHHVMYSYGSAVGGQKLFVDKVEVASGVQTTSTGSDHDFIGIGARDAGTNDYTGEIDDLRIYGQAYTLTEASKIYDAYGTTSVDEKGRRLELFKNSWYNLNLGSPIVITENTVIEFDFESTAEGEVQGIGFNNSTDPSTLTNVFKLFGTEASGILNYDNYQLVDGIKHYKIPVGQFYTGSFSYLTFVCDDDVSVDTPNASFSNIQIFEEKEVYSIVENSSSAIAFNGAEILEVSGHPNIQGLDHGIVFGIKTTCKNATILKRGGFDGDGYEISINDNGYLVVSYTVFPTTYSLTFVTVINDDVLHRVAIYLDNTNKTVDVCVDGELLSQSITDVLAVEPTGPFFMGGHDGYHPDAAHYVIPKTFNGYLDFVKVNSSNVSLLKTMSMAQRTDVLSNSIKFLEGYSPILFKEGNVPAESYGTIIVAVKVVAPITSKITILSSLGAGSNKVNLRATSGAVISFEKSGVSEYDSSHTVSEDEVLVFAITSISGENQVYITKNLSGRETVATTADYQLPTQVVGELGPFELIRMVGYSTPLTEVEERYLIRQIMKHPNVGLL